MSSDRSAHDRKGSYRPSLLYSFVLNEVTGILSAIERGDRTAAGKLLPLVYDELRKLAAQKLAQEKPGQTLQATALVHEVYLRLVTGAEAQQFIEQSVAVAHQVQLEDMGVCEEVQRGLKSRSFDTGRFSVRREAAGYHFHRLLARYLAAGPRPA